VQAVQLKLDTDGFSYKKWGSNQHCKPNDWLVDNAGAVYTVDQTTFAKAYRQVQPGCFLEITPVWAGQARADGIIDTIAGKPIIGRVIISFTTMSIKPMAMR
jgi:hypothetical protein